MFRPIHEWTKQDLIDALIAWDKENSNDDGQIYTMQDYADLHHEVYARGIFETYLEKQ